MTVYELTDELAGNYLDEKNAQRGEGTSYYELVEPFEFVSRKEVMAYYDNYIFSNDDFSCTAGRG